MSRVKSPLLSGLLAIAALAGSPLHAHADFTTITGWDRQLFPSYIVATATQAAAGSKDKPAREGVLGNGKGLLGVTVLSPADDTPVKVTITSNSILEPSTFTGTLAKEGQSYTVAPYIRFKYAALTGNTQTVPVDVTYRVQVGDEPAEEKTETLTLRSINDCPRIVVDGEAVSDVRFMFAAYVNEQHPFVDKLLREALDGEIVDSFSGYQSGKASDVYSQAYALWKALSERDVRYSSITATAVASQKVYSQHVRLIDESINNSQANCVDGSVLFASLLRKVGIEPYLVLVPGHCYIVFQVDAAGKEAAALETTLIGANLEGDALEIKELSDVVDEDEQEEASWVTFCAAFATGRKNLLEHAEKFKDPKEHDYLIISIAEARRRGILPIAFKSDAEFTPVAQDADEK